MTSPTGDSAPDEQRDDQDLPENSIERAEKKAAEGDGHDDDGDQDGQVSETTAMTPGSGADGTPGTDDGVPPAEDAGSMQGFPPKPYGNGNHS